MNGTKLTTWVAFAVAGLLGLPSNAVADTIRVPKDEATIQEAVDGNTFVGTKFKTERIGD